MTISLMVHALTLLIPYSNQLRCVSIKAPIAIRSLILSMLNSTSLSRLVALRAESLGYSETHSLPLSFYVLPFNIDIHSKPLDLRGSTNCFQLSLGDWASAEEATLPRYLTHLKVTGSNPAYSISMTSLQALLDSRALQDLTLSDFQLSGSQEPVRPKENLLIVKSLHLVADENTVVSMISGFPMPRLEILTVGSGPRLGWNLRRKFYHLGYRALLCASIA